MVKFSTNNIKLVNPMSADQNLVAVAVGPGPSFGTPQRLFQTSVEGVVGPQRTHYVPNRVGQRFLINTPVVGQGPVTAITVELNATAAFTR